MKATKQQLNIISNAIASNSSGESRSAMKKIAVRLFSESEREIEDAICNHPINLNWEFYRTATKSERDSLLLPEN